MVKTALDSANKSRLVSLPLERSPLLTLSSARSSNLLLVRQGGLGIPVDHRYCPLLYL